MEGAHNMLLELEELDEKELDRIKAEYRKLAEKARKDLKKGKEDTGVPQVKT
jgi:DNA polymerase III delta prime subunit